MIALRHLFSASATLLLLLTPATAQMPGARIRPDPSGGPRQEGFVRIQTNVSFFVAGPTGEGEEAQKLRDRSRRTIYEMAARECDLLREVLAQECRLESINSTININNRYGGSQQDGYTVNGAMSLQITLK